MSYQLNNSGPIIEYVPAGAEIKMYFMIKKDIIEVIPVTDKVVKIKFRKKRAVYLSIDNIPYFHSATTMASKIVGWITDDACCGNYPPSDEPLPA